ncbi:uncharacterized protein LOC143017857 isoform X2 [Oratosquilla oratoria]
MSDGSVHEEIKETSHNIVHTKDEDFVEYYAVPKGATLAEGVKIGEGMHVVSEDFQENREGEADNLDSLSERVRQARRLGYKRPPENPERKDAITKKPLDYEEEEETRKKETNRWLEHHFGSESGRSKSSHEDEDDIRSGGNIINITMSPRPSSPVDEPDSANRPLRKWQATSPLASSPSKAPPPPPPPKPYNNSIPSPPPPPPVHEADDEDDGQDAFIVSAKAKLRSTGRKLETLEKKTENVTQTASTGLGGPRYTGLPERVQVLPTGPGGTFNAPNLRSPTNTSGPSTPVRKTIQEDPVYSSRFRSGSPTLGSPRYESTPVKSWKPSDDSPPATPPPLPNTPPPNSFNATTESCVNNSSMANNVGRSQSFNVTARTWGSPAEIAPIRPYREEHRQMTKQYKSEEQLDSVGRETRRSEKRWPPPPRERSPSPEENPPPPPRYKSPVSTSHSTTVNKKSSSKSSKTSGERWTSTTNLTKSNKVESSTMTSQKEMGTQTGHSPVPPPRTKRKVKPKNTYYFGQDSDSNNVDNIKSLRKSKSKIIEEVSPKLERRFTTTKIITPVISMSPTSPNGSECDSRRNSNFQEFRKNFSNRVSHYRSMDELSQKDETPKSSWTNTIDRRRRPISSKEAQVTKESTFENDASRAKTLPRKVVNDSLSSPKKTYYFGEGEPKPRSSSSRNGSLSSSRYGGSLINVSIISNNNNEDVNSSSLKKSSLRNHNSFYNNDDYKSLNENHRRKHESFRSVTDSYRSKNESFRINNESRGSLNNSYKNENDTYYSLRTNSSNSSLNKSVGRSQSFNTKPAPLTNSLKKMAEAKNSVLYKSTPHIAKDEKAPLRSPNLIATIARTASMKGGRDQNVTDDTLNGESVTPSRSQSTYSPRRSTTPLVNGDSPRNTSKTKVTEGEEDKDNRTKFMKGLLNTAPELFHFIHGDEDLSKEKTPEGKVSPESPPRLIRPSGSPASPLSPNSPLSPASPTSKVFNFTKMEDRLNRSNSAASRNDSIRTNLSNNTQTLNRPKFNLKSGGSLLNSSSFRNDKNRPDYSTIGHSPSSKTNSSSQTPSMRRESSSAGYPEPKKETTRTSSTSNNPNNHSSTEKTRTRSLRYIPTENGVERIDSDETTTFTKSKKKNHEVIYPKKTDPGLKYSLQSHYRPQHTDNGGVVIEIKDWNSR